MKSTRKSFMAGMAATVCAPSATLAAEGKPRARVGLLSDIHVVNKGTAADFERALRRLDAEKVDAVAITGDLSVAGGISELRLASEIWYKVFPDGRRSDGGRVEKLIVTGNHDEIDWNANARYRLGPDEECFALNREKMWEELFRERYEPISIRRVNGVAFVLRQWMCRSGWTKDLEAFFDARGEELKGDVFFHLQHEPVYDTVNSTWLFAGGRWMNPHGCREARAIFDRYPNAVVLTGHSHNSLTDETSIWQGEFTAVNCSRSGGYVFTRPGRENGLAHDDHGRMPPFEMPSFDNRTPKHAMVMDVFRDRVVFHRLFIGGGVLADDWTVPLFAGGAAVPAGGTPKYDFKRRAESSPVPEFAAGARVTVELTDDGRRRHPENGMLADKEPRRQVIVKFPSALVNCRAFDYSVCIRERFGDTERVLAEKRVFSEKWCHPASHETLPVTCVFARDGLVDNRAVEIAVRPWNSWNRAGKPIFFRGKIPPA